MKRLLLLVLLLPFVMAEVSSAEADGIAALYIQGESMSSLSQPMEVGMDSYWVYYTQVYPPVSRKLVVAVGQFYGTVLEDEDELFEVASAAYDYGIVYSYLEPNGYSFKALSPTLYSVVNSIRQNDANLYDLATVTEAKYSFIDFSAIEANSTLLLSAADDLNVLFQDGYSQQQISEDYYSAKSLSTLVYYYGLAFESMDSFFDVYEDYLGAINKAQSTVYTSSIPSPDDESIYDSLENLKDIGVNNLYSKFTFSKPRAAFESLRSARSAWVNDSVSSFSFVSSRANSISSYNANLESYEFIASSKAVLTSCGLKAKVEDLEGVWAEIVYYKGKSSALGYSKMLELLPAAESLIDEVYAGYSSCTSNPTVAPVKQEQDDYSGIVYAIAITLLAYGGYLYWQKLQAEKQE